MTQLQAVPNSTPAAAPNAKPKPRPIAAFRRMLQLARPEWKLVAIATVFLLVGSGAQLLFPKQMGTIIDQAVQARSQGPMDRTALAMVGLFAVMGVSVSIRYILFTVVGERVVARLRADLFARLIEQEIGFFDERRTGELTNRLASDTAVLQNTVSANISMGLRHLAMIGGGLTFLAVTSVKLTLLMLVVVPPVALGAMAYGRRVRKLSREVQDTLAKSSEVAEETLSGIRTVRMFAAEQAEEKRYRAAVMRSFELARHRAYVAGAFMGGAQFFGFGAVVVVLWFGSRMVLAGEMSVGGLTSFIVYTVLVAGSLGAYSELWAEFNKAAGAGERVFELLDRVPRMPHQGGQRLPSVRGEVRFEQVHFTYPARPDVPVLKGIELSAQAGEIVALVGPSGAGKSTIASLIARLYDPAAGRVLLDGTDLRELDPEWLRQQVGTVAQEPILFSSSIAENIRYARPGASDAEVEAAARTANAHEFVSRFPEGYQTLVGERGVQLSGGQKQRVAIARAVLKDPRVLILDEATSALDAESEHLVKEALERLMQGRTTLVIAHRLSTVIDANRVLVLEGGTVVQSGSHASLMGQEGLYKRLVERQFVAA